MNIRQVIEYLKHKPVDQIVSLGFSAPYVYHEGCTCLGVEPTRNMSVGDMLQALRNALIDIRQGWQGMDFVAKPSTDVRLALYGDEGELITSGLMDEMFQVYDTNVVAHPKTLKQLKKALNAAGVIYHVRHVLFSSPMPRAVTIATTKRIDVSHLNDFVIRMMEAIRSGDVADGESVGSFVKHQLADVGYSYVAVCSWCDVFNQTMGETIALGRMLKAQRKHVLPFDRRMPALPSRRRNDAQRRQTIVRAKALAKVRAMFTPTNPRCVLRVCASGDTTSCICPQTYLHEGMVQDVVIGCRTAAGYVSHCSSCKLVYGSDGCTMYCTREHLPVTLCYARFKVDDE